MNLEYISPGFYELICDASFSLFAAKMAEDDYARNRFSRSSILSSALSVESFSNCLINAMSLSDDEFKEYDRFPTIRKIELFLKLLGESPLDKGSTATQKITDLIKLRNDFVHVKTTSINGTHEGYTDVEKWRFEDIPEYDIALKVDSYAALNVSKSSTAWHPKDAHSALSAVSEFLISVITNLNHTNNSKVRISLAPQLKIADIQCPVITEEIRNEIRKLKSIGIDLEYLTEI